ncbi:class F sortase [Frigoribacterium sp. 2-23]|uniref:class F sortase n=1 Tax=Frigoribacterium sp. 2-23 TaxID=3415006 RepID=UPI003C701813
MSAAELIRSHRRAAIAIGVAVVVLIGGGVTLGAVAAQPNGSTSPAEEARGPSSTSAAAPNATSGFQDPAAPSYTEPPAGSTPVRVQIPSIGVDSGLEDLGIGPQGELDPPKEWMSAGWFAGGVVPGGVGPAVIAGHIDSTSGPAVFARLGDLAPGAEIQVTLSTGAVETFTVSGSERAPKKQFPTSDVYGSSPTPSLRLITCDGHFDTSTGHYDDNLIVFADLVV